MFSENYSVCLKDDGSPREIERNGPVITYKATGYESGRMVAMQLIPLAAIDEGERVRFEESARIAQEFDHPNLARIFDVGIKDDHFVFVSEYLEGETADEWIGEHGAMAADAVLRIGLQAVNALGAAAAHGLTHGSIQPANLIILPGVAFDGGWPRIKVRNFGLPGLKFQSAENETREVVPPMAPEFCSPEQLENGVVDFRSDIFSLGATMWFLLTGAAPPATAPTESGPRLSTSGVIVPRFVRNLVGRMLRKNPEERPQDPVALAETIHACLQKAERRTAFTRSFVPAAIPTLPRREKKRLIPALALAVLVAAFAALAGLFFWRSSQRESKPLGVMIGVPETSEASPARVSQPAPAPPTVTEKGQQVGSVAQSTTPSGSPAAPAITDDKLTSSPELAVNNRMAEPPTPAEGPSQTSEASINAQPPAAEKNPSPPADLPNPAAMAANDSSPTTTTSNEPPTSSEPVVTRKRNDSSASKAKSRRQRLAKSSSSRRLPPLRVGAEPVRVVATTPDGNLVLRLPSGETIVTPPVPDIDEVPVISHRRVRRVERPMPLVNEPPVIVLPPQW